MEGDECACQRALGPAQPRMLGLERLAARSRSGSGANFPAHRKIKVLCAIFFPGTGSDNGHAAAARNASQSSRVSTDVAAELATRSALPCACVPSWPLTLPAESRRAMAGASRSGCCVWARSLQGSSDAHVHGGRAVIETLRRSGNCITPSCPEDAF